MGGPGGRALPLCPVTSLAPGTGLRPLKGEALTEEGKRLTGNARWEAGRAGREATVRREGAPGGARCRLRGALPAGNGGQGAAPRGGCGASLGGRFPASRAGNPVSRQEQRMGEPVTDSTYVRCLSYGLVRRLAEFIDPQEGWKKLAVDITNASGESRYSQVHIRCYIKVPYRKLVHYLFNINTLLIPFSIPLL